MAKRTNAGGITKGSWSEAEDNVLRAQVKMRGDDELCNGWAEIAENIPGRSAKQCRERWVQNLKPSLCRGPISAEESEFIKKQVSILGPKWAEIARLLKSHGISIRSDNAVKNWYNGNKNRMKRAQRRGREIHDPDMLAPVPTAHHHHPSRHAFQPAPLEVPPHTQNCSPLASPHTPATPYSFGHSHAHSYSHSYHQSYSSLSRPSSQHAAQQYAPQYHHHHHHHHQPQPPQQQHYVPYNQQLSPRQLPLPQPRGYNNTNNNNNNNNNEERRGSVYSLTALNSPASDAVLPSLEPDMGSPVLGASQPSPAMPLAHGPLTYSLYNAYGHTGESKPMARTWSQQSNQSQHRLLLEPDFAPKPPGGSERLSVNSLLN